MSNLQPLPPPGLAIMPQYLSNGPLTVILKGSSFSRSMTATTGNGDVLFTTEGKSFSRSHRRAFLDASGQKLFEIRKDGMGLKRYYAEVSENGPRLIETETHTKMFSRPRTTVRFANQADPSRQMIEMDFLPAGRGNDGNFSWGGREVARVEKLSLSLSGEYQLTLSPGMDPALVVAVMVAMIDRARTQASNNAAAASG